MKKPFSWIDYKMSNIVIKLILVLNKCFWNMKKKIIDNKNNLIYFNILYSKFNI